MCNVLTITINLIHKSIFFVTKNKIKIFTEKIIFVNSGSFTSIADEL